MFPREVATAATEDPHARNAPIFGIEHQSTRSANSLIFNDMQSMGRGCSLGANPVHTILSLYIQWFSIPAQTVAVHNVLDEYPDASGRSELLRSAPDP